MCQNLTHIISDLPNVWEYLQGAFAAKPPSSFFRLFLWVSPLSFKASLEAQRVKHLPAVWENQVHSLGREDPLEKEMAPHSSTLAWKIPWTEKPGMLQSMGSQTVRHDWATSLSFFFLSLSLQSWQGCQLRFPTPPKKKQDFPSLAGQGVGEWPELDSSPFPGIWTLNTVRHGQKNWVKLNHPSDKALSITVIFIECLQYKALR